jgi:hypothetical protein
MSVSELQVTDILQVSQTTTVICVQQVTIAQLEPIKRTLVPQELWANMKVLNLSTTVDHANLTLTTICGVQEVAKDVVPLHSLSLTPRLIS